MQKTKVHRGYKHSGIVLDSI